MEVVQAQDKAKVRRDKTKEAIALALDGRWEEAVEVNREILYFFPEDAEALNRMGKAHLELGHYAEAEDAFRHSLRVAPHNTIAKKNLERLAQLQKTRPKPQQSGRVTVQNFIEETGRSAITNLHDPAPTAVLAKMAAGDIVKLSVKDSSLLVLNANGDYVGRVEPRLAARLVRLTNGGNRYEAAITSVSEGRVAVIVKETFRHPSLSGVASFPSASGESYGPYVHGAMVGYEAEADDDDGEDEAPTWKEDADGGEDEEFEEGRVSDVRAQREQDGDEENQEE